ncbi:MAG TPA: P-loop NTPase [Acidimicrobiales bacterium]|nr:P-loop NTPase [Acidimicrobiales bacterium]
MLAREVSRNREDGAPGQREDTRAHVASFASSSVLLVEEDHVVLDHLLKAVRGATPAQAFPNLDALDGAVIHPGRPVLLVLGPSQATPEVLDRVGALLKATQGAGAVLVVEHSSTALMRIALRSGVNDAIELSQIGVYLPDALEELAIRLEEELAAPPAKHGAGRSAHRRAFVTTVFSPKGGVGKSVIAVNLAAALARASGEPVVVLDLDLQFGDVAVMLRLQPVHTFTDAVSAGEDLDETLLRSFLARHDKSGVSILAAPTSPSEADRVDSASMLRVLDILRGMSSHVVIDTPPHLSEVVLQAVAESDMVGFVVAMEVPSVKNARLGLQAFELLQLPLNKVVLLLNRANSKVHLKPDDIEKFLDMKVDIALPSDAAVPQSINQGVPALLEYPRSQWAGQIDQLAGLVLARAEEPGSSGGTAKR